jgi:hypothetical protein
MEENDPYRCVQKKRELAIQVYWPQNTRKIAKEFSDSFFVSSRVFRGNKLSVSHWLRG